MFDESTSVFIHNLVPEVSDEDIIKFFTSTKGALGIKRKVEAVRLIRDQRLRLCKGIGYVKFNSRKAAATALEMDGSNFMGRHLKVNKVKKMKNPKGDVLTTQEILGLDVNIAAVAQTVALALRWCS